MEIKYYNPIDEKGGWVVRYISKALNKDYHDTKSELIKINENYNNDTVFEKYLLNNNFFIDVQVKKNYL